MAMDASEMLRSSRGTIIVKSKDDLTDAIKQNEGEQVDKLLRENNILLNIPDQVCPLFFANVTPTDQLGKEWEVPNTTCLHI